jgi:outer membrane protein assembly factor BamB
MSDQLLYLGINGHVVAIDPVDGGEVWRTPLRTGLFLSAEQQQVCVLVHDGSVFAGCHGLLFCLDAESGDVLWTNELKGLGHNAITLAMAGTSVQFAPVRSGSSG